MCLEYDAVAEEDGKANENQYQRKIFTMTESSHATLVFNCLILTRILSLENSCSPETVQSGTIEPIRSEG
jgi:hypothetical protein